MFKKTLLLIMAVIISVSGAYVYQKNTQSNSVLNPEQFKVFTVLPQPRALGDLGLPALKSDNKHWQLLFFGFTNCPDVCPNTMAIFKHAYLKANAPENLKITLISIDPERDKPAQVGEYARYFHPNFVGTTGTPAQLEALGKKLGAVWQKVAVKGAGGYTMDHSATLFLLNPEGNLAAVATPPLTAATLAQDLVHLQ